MPCIPPPPSFDTVVATVEIKGTAPNFTAVFRTDTVNDPLSQNYIDKDGNLDFSCVHQQMWVQLTMYDPAHYVFYRKGARNSLLFLDDAASTGAKQDLPNGHKQFPHHVTGGGTSQIVFKYRNAQDCGNPAGTKVCLRSRYGLLVGNANNKYLGVVDPIVDNGGIPPDGPPPPPPPPLPPKAQ